VGKETAPGAQELRFAAYIEGLAEAAGHADRHVPLKNYCTGLLLPGERKSVEPMAARLASDNVRRMHQSLHHVVADAPWSDEAVLDRCLDFVIPAMLRRDPVVAWVVDDTGFPKKGRESVGVARQYCGQVGKQDNCRVAVSLSVTTEKASMPVAYRLYLPQSWIEDRQRRKKTGVPDSIQFQTKPEIALALGERPCSVASHRSLEESDLASRGETETTVPLCRHASASRASRLLAIGATSGRMVVDRMASWRGGANPILAIHASG